MSTISPTDVLNELKSGQQVNSSVSGNSNARHALLRMKLQWKDFEYKFAINPEDYTQSEPNKVTITQTKGGAWIDAWGEGIKEITIKGTTGVRGTVGKKNGNPDAGYQRWKALRNMIQNVYDDVQDGEKVELMQFYNYTDNEFFYVYPAQSGIELYRSKSRPHIYQYTLHLWAARRIGVPEKERQILGDPTKNWPEEDEVTLSAQDDLQQLLDKYEAGEVDLTQVVQYVKSYSGVGTGGDDPDKALEALVNDFRSGKVDLTDVVRYVRENYGSQKVDETELRKHLDAFLAGDNTLSDVVHFVKKDPLDSDDTLAKMVRDFGTGNVGLGDIVQYVREKRVEQKNENELIRMLDQYRTGSADLTNVVQFVRDHIGSDSDDTSHEE